MTQAVVNNQIIEVNDILIDVELYGLRCFLKGRFNNNNAAKLDHIKTVKFSRNWEPEKLLALNKMQHELEASI